MHRSGYNTASPQNEFLVGYGWKTMISTKPTKNSTRELLKSRNFETEWKRAIANTSSFRGATGSGKVEHEVKVAPFLFHLQMQVY